MSRPSGRLSAMIPCTKRSAKAAAIPAWSIGCRCLPSEWTRCSIISATRRSRSSRKARTPRASASSRSRIITRRGARRWSIPVAARSTNPCSLTGCISPKTSGPGAWINPRWRGSRHSPCPTAAPIRSMPARGKKVVIALWSEGSRDRMGSMLRDHKLDNLTSVNSWRTVQATPRNEAMLAVVGMESGFETNHVAVISEQDILGDRLVRPRKASRKLDNFISEVTSLAAGDLVVHVEHGIGRFIGLQTIEVGGAPHDCLELHYAAETKLFLPVENIELLSRYGSDHANVELDRLGGGGWQARKAKLKNRIREIAGELIKIAAERHLHEAPKMPVQPHVYDEFCARFPYEETEDQLGAITSTLKDLESGRPMDRLICGDVGFGKTEVA